MDGKIRGLAHIGLFVEDIERTKKFYRDILEFNTLYECELDDADGKTQIAFIGNGSCMIEVVRFASPAKRPDGIVDHIALQVRDIEAVRDSLLEKGIRFESKEIVFNGAVFPNGSKWILFRGPDGEHLELNEVL